MGISFFQLLIEPLILCMALLKLSAKCLIVRLHTNILRLHNIALRLERRIILLKPFQPRFKDGGKRKFL